MPEDVKTCKASPSRTSRVKPCSFFTKHYCMHEGKASAMKGDNAADQQPWKVPQILPLQSCMIIPIPTFPMLELQAAS